MDEYQQYDKAAAALMEAHKTLSGVQGDAQAQELLHAMQYKLEKVRLYLQFRR